MGVYCVVGGPTLSPFRLKIPIYSIWKYLWHLLRGVARIIGLGVDHVVWSPTLRAPKLRSPCGGSGSSPRRILLIRMPEMHFPASGTITITYRTMKFNNLHLYLFYSAHTVKVTNINQCLTFYGPFKEKG